MGFGLAGALASAPVSPALAIVFVAEDTFLTSHPNPPGTFPLPSEDGFTLRRFPRIFIFSGILGVLP